MERILNERLFTLSDAVNGIMNRKYRVVIIFCTTCILIGIATLVTPKTYKSEARLFMRLGRENTSLDATATLGEHPVVMLPQSREAEINSIVELIQTKQLYSKVVDEIGADRILDRNWRPSEEGGPKPPSMLSELIGSVMSSLASIGVLNDLPSRERAVIRLQKKTEIEAFEKSNVLTVSFESYSPELAQDVVGRIVSHYQTQHVNLHRPPRAFEFLEEETERIQIELDTARVALEDFKNQTGILESTQHRTVLIERIAKLQADLLMSESNAAALDVEVRRLEDGLGRMSETTTMAVTVGAGNEGVDGMRQELYRLEVQREQLASKYTDDHPFIQQIEEQVQEAKTILAAAEADRRESIQGPNQVYQETSVALEQKRPKLAAELAKADILRLQISEFTDKLDEFTANERTFARLDRNVEVLEANYRKYFANLEQARIDTKMKAQEFSNVGIAQPATLNLKPASPNKLVNLCAAIVLGIMGGVGYAVFAEYLSLSRDSEETYELALARSNPARRIEAGSEEIRADHSYVENLLSAEENLLGAEENSSKDLNTVIHDAS
ncbi:MAG: GumC family protein [Aureliella sp.]